MLMSLLLNTSWRIEVNMFEDDTCWRSKYFKLCRELGEIINEQQDKIMSLSSENKRLNRENWNLKQTKRRIK